MLFSPIDSRRQLSMEAVSENMMLILRCLLLWLMAGANISAFAASPADAAADYVTERIRARFDGVQSQMMTDDFVFNYLEDVFTAEPTCIIRLPRQNGIGSGMPHVFNITGLNQVLLLGADTMLMIGLTPQSARLWIPDPDGDGPGIRLMASSSKRIFTIGPEHWNQLDDEAGYLIADSDLTLSLLASLYNSASLNVNPHDSPTEVQRYDMQGYFTAMNTARRLCPDNLPRQLLQDDRNPRADERVFNALEPSENDQIIDLRGQEFPISTPFGPLDIKLDAEAFKQTLTLNGKPMSIENSVIKARAILNLSGASYALISHVCTRCGNAYDAGHQLELLRLDEGYRHRTNLLDSAYLLSESLEQLTLSLDEGVVTISIPHAGTYRIEHGDSQLSIDYEAAQIHQEIAALKQERDTLHARIVDDNKDRPALQTPFKNDRRPQRLTGFLHKHTARSRSVYRPDDARSAYTLELDPPLLLIGDCAPNVPLLYLDFVSDDEALARSAEQRVELMGTLSCDKWGQFINWLDKASIAEPQVQPDMASATTTPSQSTAFASHTLVDRTWSCRTKNPDGSVSRDRYYFYDDGTFVSTSRTLRVSGFFDRSGAELKLTFTLIVAQRVRRTVKAQTSALIAHLDEQALEFTSIDATTSAERRVICRG